MPRVLDSYNEIGFLKPFLNKLKRIGPDPRYWAYRTNWWLVNKLHYVTRFPIHVDIESTNFCNLKCTMCPHSVEEFSMAKGYFNMDTYRGLLPQFQAGGIKSLKLNMRGEPLLNRNLAEMVALAKEHGILEVMFNTNGLLLTESKTRELAEAGLDYLIVSIDGATAKTYNAIRRGGDFDTLRRNLEYFVAYRRHNRLKKPLLRLQFVEMEENRHEVAEYLAMWEGKADVMTVNQYSNRGCGERQAHEMVPVGRVNCFHPWRRMSISWKGEAMMCCGDWQNRCVLGDVAKISISDIWHSPRLADYRGKLKARRLNEIPCCKDCFVLASYAWERKDHLKQGVRPLQMPFGREAERIERGTRP
jgi:MoaA/NifB/PqqE/SkfB family radical SAM enzyme